LNKNINSMKILTELALAITIFTTSVAPHAEWVSGHFRSNGTYVALYYRTDAKSIPYDNLSCWGYHSQQPGYISPRSYGLGSAATMPRFDFDETGYRSLM
jgi:hypothetical protein